MTSHQQTTASASFEPLTPTAFLDRSAQVFADRVAVVDGANPGDRTTYAQLRDRCLRQAGALAGLGVSPGDRVAVLAPNTRLLLESHYGVPYAGAVLVALNVRLSADELAYVVGHAGCHVLVHDPSLADLAAQVADAVAAGAGQDTDDDGGETGGGTGHGDGTSPQLRLVDGGEPYERLLAGSEPTRVPVQDETGLFALNYTSGTTGRPKGVMYHHRGAYLQSLAMVTHFGLTSDSTYLWTLPMFHCNGWCFTWAVTAAGGTHVCLPRVEPDLVWGLLDHADLAVSHLCAAPTVLTGLLDQAPDDADRERRVVVAVGGAPPSPSLLEQCAALGLDVTHLYGLTETYGPVVICDWRSEWNELPTEDQARRRARQGVGNTVSCAVRVVDGLGADVTADGESLGEVALRGNNVMLGYYRDEEATATSIPDGWLRTGDVGVLHPDGYLEIRDRAKDVIISGGENISSVEVEAALVSHPAVLEAAVVPVPDDRWGERPAAWVTLKEGEEVTSDELRDHVRGRLAGFKVPDRVEFGDLPKTGTGKIKKFELREQAWEGRTRVGS